LAGFQTSINGRFWVSTEASPATADYGAVERGVEEKIAQVLAQVRSGEARLVFDPETETANIAPARDLPQR
jgi:uncharacterized protein YheU (UPF0270 family)